MTDNISVLKSSRVPRWLAVAGLALSLAVPLSANAAYQDNSAVEILVGAAVAYAIIDVAGGFDNNHQHDRRHSSNGYRDGDRDHYQRHYTHDRRYWAKDQRHRHDKHAYKHKHAANRRESGRYHR